MGMYENYGDFTNVEEAVEGMLGLGLMSNMGSIIMGIVTYVFMALGLYTIAKRRGIHNAWLAWIPFGNVWLLGCISDQYRYVAMGQEKSKRKVMLGLDIATAAVGIAAIVMLLGAVFRLMGKMDSHLGVLEEELLMEEMGYFSQVIGPLFGALGLCLVMCGTAIALTVLQYMAMYDLFRSCNPATSAVFLVLSIVMSLVGFGIVQAIFIFASRNKDLGMPPRHYQMYSEQPVWQPPQPPVDPWDNNHVE